ncbi:MAG: hypothetical protein ACYC6G_05680 [Desulfobaccales bacterium]
MSGPSYHGAGIQGNDYSRLKPKTEYRLILSDIFESMGGWKASRNIAQFKRCQKMKTGLEGGLPSEILIFIDR